MAEVPELSGRIVMVTGATRGIGRETALAFGRAGCRLVIVGRSTAAAPHRMLPGTLEEVVATLRATDVEVLPVEADLATLAGIQDVTDRTVERYGGCDILINNAAYSTNFGETLSTPVARWNTAWKVNLLAPLMLCQHLVPRMIEQGYGRVVNISSGASVSHVPGQAPYGATKAALEHLTTAIAADYPNSPGG